MTTPKHTLEGSVDRAAEQIRAAHPETTQVEQAAERVWQRLLADGAGGLADTEAIHGCRDFQALIPQYREGGLPESRRLLVEDHLRGCVPCRRALKAHEQGGGVAASTPTGPSTGFPLARWALAASAIMAAGLAAWLVWETAPFGGGPAATVRTVDGTLFRVASSAHLPLEVGHELREGERIRTGREGGAVVELTDGSRIEMRARSELSVERSRRGTTLELERGSVIVEAAPRESGHLFVSTRDCLVSVTGTIFSVNNGTKGSRVAVIQGEVRVDYDGEEAVLTPGEQLTTSANLTPVAVQQEIAWSRNVDRYIGVLQELAELRRDLREKVARPGQRFGSRLLDLTPEGTVFYAAVPNLGETIEDTHRVISERIEASPVLAEWWERNRGSELEPQVEEIVSKLAELSELLGDEVVVSAKLRERSGVEGPLVLAEIVDAAAVRDFIEREASRLSTGELEEVHLTFVEDPLGPVSGEGVFIWLADDLLVATPQPSILREVAEIALGQRSNPFTETEFYARISELYGEGVELLVAVDLEEVVDHSLAGSEEKAAEAGGAIERLGLDNLQHLMVEQKGSSLDLTHHRAVLTFRSARRGVASWLAEPAPMGALEFISADAKVVLAAVFKDPVSLIDELSAMAVGGEGWAALHDFESRHGLSLRDDLAGAIGGEVAFAVDGPLFPEPSWKLVVEVYDPARLQWSLEQALAELNTTLALQGQPEVVLETAELGGRTFYTVRGWGLEVHYTFVSGYLIAGPNRGLLDRAIRFEQSGYTFKSSPRFTALLPADAWENFSAVGYQDMSSLLQPLAQRLSSGGGLNEAQQKALQELESTSSASLAYAYGEADRIIVASAGGGDVVGVGLLSAVGIQDPAGLSELLQMFEQR